MSRLAADRRQEIYSSVLSLVADHGYDAVTMDQIATMTRSSKATLYRHWDNKADLVAAAAAGVQPGGSDVPDTGSLSGDVHELVRIGLDRFTDVGKLAGALSHAAHRHPELQRALLDVVLSGGVFGLSTLLDRAVARGELPADHPGLQYAPMLMIAIVHLGPVLGTPLRDRTLDVDSVRHYVDHVLLPTLGVTTANVAPMNTATPRRNRN